MKKKNAAAENTHTAALRAAALLADAKSRVAPLVDQGRERITPLADAAKVHGAGYAQSAKVRSADYAHQAVDALQPRVNDALDQVSPAVEKLRQQLDDLVPRINAALDDAAKTPVVVDNKKALVKGGKVKVVDQTPKNKSAIFLPLLLLAALGGVAAFAWKRFMGSSDSDWQSQATSAYQPPKDTTATSRDINTPPATATTTVTETAAAPSAAATTTATAGATTAESVSEPSDVVANDVAASPDRSKYGDGAFVGIEPPAGFAIKGNERSMKYHTSDTGGYERTIADVWFKTEADAEAAGFTKAQR